MRLPSEERLRYLKLLGEVVLLVLLVPCILAALLRDPRRAIEHARIT